MSVAFPSMKIFRFTLLTLAGILAYGQAVRGQSVSIAAATVEAIAVAQQRYTATFVAQPLLYDGPEYIDYANRYPTHTGHQYYTTSVPQTGTVFYNNHYFSAVPLLYDAVLDQVVLPLLQGPYMLRLQNEHVRDFTLGQHRFVRLVADSTAAGTMRTGFYEVLADGQVQLLARRTKRFKEDLNQRFVEATFTVIDKYFLSKEGRYYAISRKGPLLKLLADHDKALLATLKAQTLSFDKLRFEAALVQLVTYYNGLPLQ